MPPPARRVLRRSLRGSAALGRQPCTPLYGRRISQPRGELGSAGLRRWRQAVNWRTTRRSPTDGTADRDHHVAVADGRDNTRDGYNSAPDPLPTPGERLGPSASCRLAAPHTGSLSGKADGDPRGAGPPAARRRSRGSQCSGVGAGPRARYQPGASEDAEVWRCATELGHGACAGEDCRRGTARLRSCGGGCDDAERHGLVSNQQSLGTPGATLKHGVRRGPRPGYARPGRRRAHHGAGRGWPEAGRRADAGGSAPV
jgi:hypothetical protein